MGPQTQKCYTSIIKFASPSFNVGQINFELQKLRKSEVLKDKWLYVIFYNSKNVSIAEIPEKKFY